MASPHAKTVPQHLAAGALKASIPSPNADKFGRMADATVAGRLAVLALTYRRVCGAARRPAANMTSCARLLVVDSTKRALMAMEFAGLEAE